MRVDVTVRLPIRTENRTNHREHWRSRHRRDKSHRHQVFYALRLVCPDLRRADRPLEITIVRIGARDMDSDGLQAAAKAVRDEVANCIGLDDSSDVLRWRYEQRRGLKRGDYACEITIKSVTDAEED